MNAPVVDHSVKTLASYLLEYKTEQAWQLKWPPMTCLVLNWQLTSLACEMCHNNKFWLARWLQLSRKHYVPIVTYSIGWFLQVASTIRALGMPSARVHIQHCFEIKSDQEKKDKTVSILYDGTSIMCDRYRGKKVNNQRSYKIHATVIYHNAP